MNRFIRPRWRLTLAFAAGTVMVGVAWAVSPDTSARGFAIAAVIPFGVMAVVNAIVNYVWAGKDTDEGAIRGLRADERQKQVSGRALALAGMTGLAVAAAGFAITAAVAGWGAAWPFVIMVILPAAGLLAGLAVAVRPWSSREFPVAAVIVYGVAAVAAASGRDAGAGDHGDGAAGFGSGVDERQNQISRRAWALAGMTVWASAYAGYVAALAVRGERTAWPFLVVGCLAALGWRRGLTRYGADGPGLYADADDGPAPRPGPPQPELTPFGFGHYRLHQGGRRAEHSTR
jgi:hypothetical protein